MSNWAKSILFSSIKTGFELVATYIEANETADQNMEVFKGSDYRIEDYISREVQENVSMAEEYFKYVLHESYSEITKSILSKRAGLIILEKELSFIQL